MNTLASELGAQFGRPVARLLDAVATGANTVQVEGSSTSVTLPAIIPVSTGDRCAVLEQPNAGGLNRIIVGPIGGGPGGVVGWAMDDEDHASIGTVQTDVNGMSVTFEAIAGRLYKATFAGVIRQVGGSGAAQVFISGPSPGTRQVYDLDTNERAGFCVTLVFEAATGSITVKGQAATSANTVTVLGASGYRRWLLVEDIGAA